MSDQTITRNVKIRISADDDTARGFGSAVNRAKGARRDIDAIQGPAVKPRFSPEEQRSRNLNALDKRDELEDRRADRAAVASRKDAIRQRIAESATERERERIAQQSARYDADSQSWKQWRGSRAEELRSRRSASSSAMMEDFRRQNLYGSPGDGYGGMRQYESGRAMTGGGDAGGGRIGASGRKAFHLIAGAGADAAGLGGQFAQLSELGASAGAMAAPVAVAVALAAAVSKAAEHTQSLKSYTREYNDELKTSVHRWSTVMQTQNGTTSAGQSFREAAGESRAAAEAKKKAIEDKRQGLGWLDLAGGLLQKGVTGRSDIQQEFAARTRAAQADYDSAGRLEKEARRQDAVAGTRRQEDRYAALGASMRWRTRDPYQRAREQTQDEGDTALTQIKREREDKAAQIESAFTEASAKADGAKQYDLKVQRAKDLKKLDEESAKDEELQKDKTTQRLLQLQSEHDETFRDRKSAHNRRMVDLDGENNVALLELDGRGHTARLAQISNQYDAELREIEAKYDKQIAAESNGERRKELNRQKQGEKDAAKKKADAAAGGENRQWDAGTRQFNQDWSMSVRGVREDLAARSLRLNGKQYDADKLAVQSRLREQLQGMDAKMREEIDKSKEKEKEIRLKYSDLAQGAKSQAAMSLAELEDARSRQFNPIQNFSIAGESRLLSGAVPKGANVVADNIKLAAKWAEKTAGIEEKMLDQITQLVAKLIAPPVLAGIP